MKYKVLAASPVNMQALRNAININAVTSGGNVNRNLALKINSNTNQQVTPTPTPIAEYVNCINADGSVITAGTPVVFTNDNITGFPNYTVQHCNGRFFNGRFGIALENIESTQIGKVQVSGTFEIARNNIKGAEQAYVCPTLVNTSGRGVFSYCEIPCFDIIAKTPNTVLVAISYSIAYAGGFKLEHVDGSRYRVIDTFDITRGGLTDVGECPILNFSTENNDELLPVTLFCEIKADGGKVWTINTYNGANTSTVMSQYLGTVTKGICYQSFRRDNIVFAERYLV